MIHIDKDQKTVSLVETQDNTLTFPLLTAFVCPICSKIILAYWQDDNSVYSPLDYLPDPEQGHFEEHYITFRVPFAKGIEIQNHKCKDIYSYLNFEENIRAFLYKIHRKTNGIPLLKDHTLPEATSFLQSYGATLIFDICGRESPMLRMTEEMIEGKWDYRVEPYEAHSARRDERVQKFLSFFNEKLITNKG
jgi:hypothetical protein